MWRPSRYFRTDAIKLPMAGLRSTPTSARSDRRALLCCFAQSHGESIIIDDWVVT
jgi:hypothetical protein